MKLDPDTAESRAAAIMELVGKGLSLEDAMDVVKTYELAIEHCAERVQKVCVDAFVKFCRENPAASGEAIAESLRRTFQVPGGN